MYYLHAEPERILSWFVLRWKLEVTFQEVRRHLGVETQRQWSDLAIRRTTPALLGLFSLVTLWAGELRGMPPLRHIHGRPPGMPSRCRPSATPSPRYVVRSGAQRHYRCPGQARRRSKFPSPYCSAWSTPSATPPDAAHPGPFGETMNRSAQIMVAGKSSSGG